MSKVAELEVVILEGLEDGVRMWKRREPGVEGVPFLDGPDGEAMGMVGVFVLPI